MQFGPRNGVKKVDEQKKGHQKIYEGKGWEKHEFGSTKIQKTKNLQYFLKSSPQYQKKSPKYADHPPNAEHGFAALYCVYNNYMMNSLKCINILCFTHNPICALKYPHDGIITM